MAVAIRQKNSRQRTAIKAFLASRTDHPTAAIVYQELQKEYPNISLGTVYRNLNLMHSLGEIQKIDAGGESDRFDGRVEPHYHHVCTCCGAVHDIPMQIIAGINDLAQNFTSHQISFHQTSFFGICSDCRQTSETE